MRLLALSLCLALCAAASVRAAADDDGFCRNGGFPTEQQRYGLATVTGAERLAFLDDMDGCPNEQARCRQRAHVVAGNRLLTGRAKGPYVCAFFPNRGGGSAGWVRTDRLSSVSVDAAPPLSAWSGAWADGDNTITLKRKAGALTIDGAAYWPSANPPASVAPGGPNEGELSGTIRPKANVAAYTDGETDGCRATLTLVGPWLIAADNNQCGGANVSFSSVYRRRQAMGPATRPKSGISVRP